VITWQAQDQKGNVYATQTQNVTVVENDGQACCAPDQSVEHGRAGQALDFSALTATCTLLTDGGNFVAGGSGADRLAGGAGSDYLSGGGGDDVLLGGAGADYLSAGAGAKVTIYAGAGDDTVDARFAASARIFGGSGADVLVGSAGADQIFPGSGALAVVCGAGDDTVTIYDVCELSRGLQLFGGAGDDTLVSPLSLTELRALGVSVDSFEHVLIDTTHAYLSDCFGAAP
jgi:Ca2+-binding RTX toxin-like protein